MDEIRVLKKMQELLAPLDEMAAYRILNYLQSWASATTSKRMAADLLNLNKGLEGAGAQKIG